MKFYPSRDTSRVLGFVLLAVGVLFLISQLFGFNVWGTIGDLSWPLFIIIPGVLLLLAAFGGRSAAGLAVPGAVVTGTGVILWFQNMTGYWESWAYAWALYPVFVGLAVMFIGNRTSNEGLRENGQRAVTVGMALFVVFGVFMEAVAFNRFAGIGSTILPLALIGVGVFLVLGGRLPGGASGEKAKNRETDTLY